VEGLVTPFMSFSNTYRGKRVLVTGHTGFKGAWLCEWLLSLGANVSGFALQPPTNPALFDQLELLDRINDCRGDIRDAAAIAERVRCVNPEFIFHLAAQPLVRLSYDQPVETYSTNVMGTVHLLEAARQLNCRCTIIAVTTDKCYENREWVHSYREEDPMGGHDPYSSSKGAAELVIAAYRRSYFSSQNSGIRLASVRAGNVIGGGDWALDRIVPDCIRALSKNQAIVVRNKVATRPWQHVLEPLSGYLWLGSQLSKGDTQSPALASGFNFGPALSSNRTVADLVDEITKHWPGQVDYQINPNAVHEAKLLNLAIDKSQHYLGWCPVWGFNRTIEETVGWYLRNQQDRKHGTAAAIGQIAAYTSDARAMSLPWSI
jgi:CDP-glucose 4,6-dehydratase